METAKQSSIYNSKYLQMLKGGTNYTMGLLTPKWLHFLFQRPMLLFDPLESEFMSVM